MTTFKTDSVQVTATSESVFNYLTDLNNFIELIPEDKVSDWKGEKDKCSFRFLNAVNLELIRSQSTPHSSIQLVSGESSPVKFTLDIAIEEDNTNCVVGQTCQADLSPMLKMMVKKPLKNLFDFISERLREKFEF